MYELHIYSEFELWDGNVKDTQGHIICTIWNQSWSSTQGLKFCCIHGSIK